MGLKAKFINKLALGIILLWSLIMGSVTLFFIFENYTFTDKLAEQEAIVSVKKDLLYRAWVASHGGVYVPITKRTPPNPYLIHIKNRDVNTTDGQQLTLMNPAYTLSQMMKDYSELYKNKGHITSKILTNPLNKPDSWEDAALTIAEFTRKAVSKKEFIDGKEYFRYLNPLVIEESCLKCHGFQGYKVGDIRGGVSVSILMEPYNKQSFLLSLYEVVVFLSIYFVGIFFIFYGRKKAKEILENKVKDYEQHIFSLVRMIEQRDSYTAGHTQRVAKYSVLIAYEMGFSADKVDDLYRACMLHDIGKISTPDSILLKPGKLTELEYNIIKEHVVVSYELLMHVDIYKEIAEIVRHHHEHFDGSGYPQGLKGSEIPMLSQIMKVADAFDAMTTNRIYKARKSVDEAILELQALADKQFNAEIVKVAITVLSDIIVEHSITQRPKTKIEKERFSYFYKDQVSEAYNIEYLEYVLAYHRTEEFDLKCLNILYLHNFTKYNKDYGWAMGDEMLKNFALELKRMNTDDFVFRLYGDDFILLNKEHFDMQEHIAELENILKGSGITVTYKHFDIRDEIIKDMADIEKLLNTTY
ncbi:MAG: HD domain-containing phosphohydrolase [Sulfurimonas sp.]|jgi:putative nucleotidyltransferase with HDIG domain